MGDADKNTPAAADTQESGGGPSAANDSAAAPAHEGGSTDAAAESAAGASDSPAESSPDNVAPTTPGKSTDDSDKKSSAEDTAATAADDADEPKANNTGGGGEPQKSVPIVASSKKARPPYKYDPNKITLRFLFANRDGLTVTVECNPSDTVGEVKGALMSVWPEDLPNCDGGETLRLVCMGKGFLMPDTRTLEDCQIPVFKTHPTPINVMVRPNVATGAKDTTTPKPDGTPNDGAGRNGGAPAGTEQTSQGCACVIL